MPGGPSLATEHTAQRAAGAVGDGKWERTRERAAHGGGLGRGITATGTIRPSLQRGQRGNGLGLGASGSVLAGYRTTRPPRALR